MAQRNTLVWTILLLGYAYGSNGITTPDGPVPIDGFTVYKTHNQSSIRTVQSKGSTYINPVYLIDLHGDRYTMGFDYGAMLATEIVDMYNTFLGSLIGRSGIDKALEAVLGEALDWQWNKFLSLQLPQDYKDEIRGIEDGGKSVGQSGLSNIIGRVLVLANAPGDVKDFLLILLREFKPHHPLVEKLAQEVLYKSEHKFAGMCSMIGLWGSRTEGGKLYTGRNLDWNENTGINKYKAVTVYHPPGKIAHATVGYVAVWGALTGMSQAGLTVHEANLEEKLITFDGFPWLLRLRYIMENANTGAEAVALWEATNNTVGFNHMVGSASDAAALAAGVQMADGSNPMPATIMETMFNYTAYFGSDDPREATATYTDNATKKTSQIGFPMTESVWRTNHGYDPLIRQNYLWSQSPDGDSMIRYLRIHDTIQNYADAGKKIGLAEAINITFVVGDKGHQEPFVCQDNTNGTNVISVAYSPGELLMAAAWERNNGTNWRPATCSPYLLFDMSKLF